jgi:hypothetical protein
MDGASLRKPGVQIVPIVRFVVPSDRSIPISSTWPSDLCGTTSIGTSLWSALGREQLPSARHTLELVLASIDELEP